MDATRTIYIVTDGDYSDYHICAVFDNPETAQSWVDFRNASRSFQSYRVEEYVINPSEPAEELRRGTIKWDCSSSYKDDGYVYCGEFRDDDQELVEPKRAVATIPGWLDTWDVTVWAPTHESAVKIAAEKIAQAKAEHAGIA